MLAPITLLLALAASSLAATAPAQTVDHDYQMTFYSYGDNDPPGNDTALHCGGRNGHASGTGTYADPLTMAISPGVIGDCELVYSPYLKKYLRNEDECATCSGKWIDVWLGSFVASGGSDVDACQDTLTMHMGFYHNLVRQPAANLEVVSALLFDTKCHPEYVYTAYEATFNAVSSSAGPSPSSSINAASSSVAASSSLASSSKPASSSAVLSSSALSSSAPASSSIAVSSSAASSTALISSSLAASSSSAASSSPSASSSVVKSSSQAVSSAVSSASRSSAPLSSSSVSSSALSRSSSAASSSALSLVASSAASSSAVSSSSKASLISPISSASSSKYSSSGVASSASSSKAVSSVGPSASVVSSKSSITIATSSSVAKSSFASSLVSSAKSSSKASSTYQGVSSSKASSTVNASSSRAATPSARSRVSPDGTCGGANGFTCKNSYSGDCCSQYGWCGDSSAYCQVTKGCNSNFGDCWGSSDDSDDDSNGNDDASGLSVSPDGSCGPSTGFTCQGSYSGSCCSQYGWCGSTKAYCKESRGCQSDYGVCT